VVKTRTSLKYGRFFHALRDSDRFWSKNLRRRRRRGVLVCHYHTSWMGDPSCDSPKVVGHHLRSLGALGEGFQPKGFPPYPNPPIRFGSAPYFFFGAIKYEKISTLVMSGDLSYQQIYRCCYHSLENKLSIFFFDGYKLRSSYTKNIFIFFRCSNDLIDGIYIFN